MTRNGPTNPDNLIGADYRRPPGPCPSNLPIIDIHAHLRDGADAAARFFRAARRYGVGRVFTMTFLEQLDEVRSAWSGRVEPVAIPDYRVWKRTTRFQRQWRRDVGRFTALGARICKVWAAPRARAERGLTLPDPWLAPVIERALDLGLIFLVHVADPDAWYATRYADRALYGTKAEAHEHLEWFLEHVAPTPVIGAHMAGHPEDLDHLDALLARHENLLLDVSATKWVAREISRQGPARTRRFFARHYRRILFGSDLVVDADRDFAHYASRYWVHRTLWQTDYDGPSPIADPDAGESPVRLRGAALPEAVLRALYHENVARLLGPGE